MEDVNLYQKALKSLEPTCLEYTERSALAALLVNGTRVPDSLRSWDFSVQTNEGCVEERLQPNYTLTCMRWGRGFILKHTENGWDLESVIILPKKG